MKELGFIWLYRMTLRLQRSGEIVVRLGLTGWMLARTLTIPAPRTVLVVKSWDKVYGWSASRRDRS
jgi:hypothetical protein